MSFDSRMMIKVSSPAETIERPLTSFYKQTNSRANAVRFTLRYIIHAHTCAEMQVSKMQEGHIRKKRDQKAMHVKKFLTMCLVFKTNRFLTHHKIPRRGHRIVGMTIRTFSQLRSKPFNLRMASILLKLIP